MKLSIFVVSLMLLFLTACGEDTSNMGAPAESNADCEFGLDGNGNCLPEGASGIPAAH